MTRDGRMSQLGSCYPNGGDEPNTSSTLPIRLHPGHCNSPQAPSAPVTTPLIRVDLTGVLHGAGSARTSGIATIPDSHLASLGGGGSLSPSPSGGRINATSGEDGWPLLDQTAEANKSISSDDVSSLGSGFSCATQLSGQIRRGRIATRCGHPGSPDCLTGLALPRLALTSLRLLSSYTSIFRQPYMPLQSRTADTSVISWPTHLGLLAAGMPPPLLRVQGCYSLQPGPRWGDQTHLRLRPVHERQALGLPRFAPVSPWWTGSRLLPRLRTRFGAPQYLFFSLDISSNLPLNCTLGFFLRLSGPPHCDLTICLYLVSRSLLPSLSINPYSSQPMHRTCVQHCQ